MEEKIFSYALIMIGLTENLIRSTILSSLGTVMVNIDCQIDRILNHKFWGMSTREILDRLN